MQSTQKNERNPKIISKITKNTKKNTKKQQQKTKPNNEIKTVINKYIYI